MKLRLPNHWLDIITGGNSALQQRLIDKGLIQPEYAGEDPESEYSILRDRIYTALEKIDPSYPKQVQGKSGAAVRAFVSEVVGYDIPNGELYECLTRIAEAVEKRAREQ